MRSLWCTSSLYRPRPRAGSARAAGAPRRGGGAPRDRCWRARAGRRPFSEWASSARTGGGSAAARDLRRECQSSRNGRERARGVVCFCRGRLDSARGGWPNDGARARCVELGRVARTKEREEEREPEPTSFRGGVSSPTARDGVFRRCVSTVRVGIPEFLLGGRLDDRRRPSGARARHLLPRCRPSDRRAP